MASQEECAAVGSTEANPLCFSTSRPCFLLLLLFCTALPPIQLFILWIPLSKTFSPVYSVYFRVSHLEFQWNMESLKKWSCFLALNLLWLTRLVGTPAQYNILLINLYQSCKVQFLSQWSWFNATFFTPYLVVLNGCQRVPEHLNDGGIHKNILSGRCNATKKQREMAKRDI